MLIKKDLEKKDIEEIKEIAKKKGLDIKAKDRKIDIIERILKREIFETAEKPKGNTKYKAVSRIKRNGLVYEKGDPIDYFDGIEELIKDGVISDGKVTQEEKELTLRIKELEKELLEQKQKQIKE